MNRIYPLLFLFLLCCVTPSNAQTDSTDPLARYTFNGTVRSTTGDHPLIAKDTEIIYTAGIDDQALRLGPGREYPGLLCQDLSLDGSNDFSVQFWVKTSADHPMVFLSQKDFTRKGITPQKKPGWALYGSGGTFAWTVGSGKRRLAYQRENGHRMPIADDQWHRMTMTHDRALSEFRLYYDGRHQTVYKAGFAFTNSEPLVIGTRPDRIDSDKPYLPEIEEGAALLQAFVDEFNHLETENVNPDEFISLIVNPEKLYREKLAKSKGSESDAAAEQLKKVDEARRKLYSNPYTVFQNRELTLLKPISRIYELEGERVIVNQQVAREFTRAEKLYPADFCMDELCIWDRVLSPEEILSGYARFKREKPDQTDKSLESLTVGVWNIWHGGLHWSTETDGWDSRLRIVEMIKEKKIDIVLMQETYSSGDFIAAELGYSLATTSDWDNCFQGANISVLSRYPIEDLHVSPESEFHNIAVKIRLSRTQAIYAMSNWYGMNIFPTVYSFHQERFEHSDNIPVLFGGDFNAVPHMDGGNSPASIQLLEAGFTDAFRELYPDPEKHPGYSHRSNRRIDQLYYKGAGLHNRSTEVISTWPGGFPSDHYLIVSTFDLDCDRKE